MAGTLYQKFPGREIDGSKIQTRPIVATFDLPLVAGYYTVEEKILVLKASAAALIVMDSVTMAANIDQLDLNKGLEIPFLMDVYRGGNNHPVTSAPFQFHSFNQGESFSTQWQPNATVQNQEEIYLFLKGSIKQHANIAALPSIKIHIAASLYLCNAGFMGTAKRG